MVAYRYLQTRYWDLAIERGGRWYSDVVVLHCQGLLLHPKLPGIFILRKQFFKSAGGLSLGTHIAPRTRSLQKSTGVCHVGDIWATLRAGRAQF
jgi:hypothetical protein